MRLSYNNLAIYYQSIGSTQEAESFLKALRIYEKNKKIDLNIAQIYSNLELVFMKVNFFIINQKYIPKRIRDKESLLGKIIQM